VDAALLRAVRSSLTLRGYSATTIEQVAVAAGVGKATIYRRWSSKAEMVFALTVHGTDVQAPPDRGSLGADLHALAGRIVELLGASPARHALPGLLSDLRADPALARRFRSLFVVPERRLVAELLDRAVARGELTTRPDPAGIHAQLLGTAFAWTFLITRRPPRDLTGRMAAAALATLEQGEAQCRHHSNRPSRPSTSGNDTAAGSTQIRRRSGGRSPACASTS